MTTSDRDIEMAANTSGAASESASGSCPLRARWRLRIALAVGACLLVAATTVIRLSLTQAAIAAPPEIDLSHATTSVKVLIDRARKAVMESPASADRWGKLGTILLAHQFDSEAIQCLRRAVEIAPGDFQWNYLLGLAAIPIDRPLAIICFQTAGKLKPQDVITHARLGELLLNEGDMAGAAMHLQRSIENSDRPDPRSLQALARVRLLEGKPREAQRFAEQAAKLVPDSRMVLEVLAQAYDRQGQKENASGLLRQIQNLPDHPLPWNDPYAAQALAFRADVSAVIESAMQTADLGDFDTAVRQLEGEWQRDRQNISVALALAQLYVNIARTEDALRVLNAVQARVPEHAEVCFRTGVVRYLRKEFDLAAAAFETAVQTKPEYSLALYNLGQSYLQLGDRQQAMDAFQRTLQIAPEFDDARLNVAQLMILDNQTEAAREQISKVLTHSPGNKEAEAMLQGLDDIR